MRSMILMIGLTLLGSGCGDGGLTMDEYANQVENLLTTMNSRIDALDPEARDQPSTMESAQTFWDTKVEARHEFIEGLESIEPPEEAAEMHAAALGIVTRLTLADERVAEFVGALESEQELSLLYESQEFLATEAVDEEAVAMCLAAQAEFDSTADREVFGDMPWIPSELREVITVAFGCTKEERGVEP